MQRRSEAANHTAREKPLIPPDLKVAIHPNYPEQQISIGGTLLEKDWAAMYAL